MHRYQTSLHLYALSVCPYAKSFNHRTGAYFRLFPHLSSPSYIRTYSSSSSLFLPPPLLSTAECSSLPTALLARFILTARVQRKRIEAEARVRADRPNICQCVRTYVCTCIHREGEKREISNQSCMRLCKEGRHIEKRPGRHCRRRCCFKKCRKAEKTKVLRMTTRSP